MSSARERLPIIDVAPLRERGVDLDATGAAIQAACRSWGFFYVVGHGVDPRIIKRLADLSQVFFDCAFSSIFPY